MQRRKTGSTATWLVLLTALQILALVAVWHAAVRTEHGQLLDTVALNGGNTIGREQISGLVDRILNAMSVVSLVAATAVIGFIALIRRRIALAILATLLILGANLTTQVLKHFIVRPDFGIDPQRSGAGNSLPSGHTAVAASVAVALVLVLPRKARVWGAYIGAGYAALAGVATMSAGWHRPSDAVASMLVVGAWASIVGLGLVFTDREDTETRSQDAHRIASTLLVLGGIAMLAVAWLAVNWTEGALSTPVDELSRNRLFVAYAGSAIGIAGVASLVMGLLLAGVHRVVPRLKS